MLKAASALPCANSCLVSCTKGRQAKEAQHHTARCRDLNTSVDVIWPYRCGPIPFPRFPTRNGGPAAPLPQKWWPTPYPALPTTATPPSCIAASRSAGAHPQAAPLRCTPDGELLSPSCPRRGAQQALAKRGAVPTHLLCPHGELQLEGHRCQGRVHTRQPRAGAPHLIGRGGVAASEVHTAGRPHRLVLHAYHVAASRARRAAATGASSCSGGLAGPRPTRLLLLLLLVGRAAGALLLLSRGWWLASCSRWRPRSGSRVSCVGDNQLRLSLPLQRALVLIIRCLCHCRDQHVGGSRGCCALDHHRVWQLLLSSVEPVLEGRWVAIHRDRQDAQPIRVQPYFVRVLGRCSMQLGPPVVQPFTI
jgi:hypothetical protein